MSRPLESIDVWREAADQQRDVRLVTRGGEVVEGRVKDVVPTDYGPLVWLWVPSVYTRRTTRTVLASVIMEAEFKEQGHE